MEQVKGHAETLGAPLDALMQGIHAHVMLGRMGTASEVANAVLFLASDEASFVTATALRVDGGYTAM